MRAGGVGGLSFPLPHSLCTHGSLMLSSPFPSSPSSFFCAFLFFLWTSSLLHGTSLGAPGSPRRSRRSSPSRPSLACSPLASSSVPRWRSARLRSRRRAWLCSSRALPSTFSVASPPTWSASRSATMRRRRCGARAFLAHIARAKSETSGGDGSGVGGVSSGGGKSPQRGVRHRRL